jgi:hypothetical protein
VSGFFERLVRPCPDCKGSGCKEFGSRTCVAGRNDGPCCPDCVGGWVDLDATEPCTYCGPNDYYDTYGPKPPVGKRATYDWDTRRRIEVDCTRCGGSGRMPSNPLAAWPIPGDTVLHDSWLLTLERVGKDDWAECEDSDLTDEGFFYQGPLSELARVVTPDDEARRAALHPSFAYADR